MSRCYPYPPPAYAGKFESNEALICTIKLQRETKKTKTEKKDRRKEKKEKKWDDKSNGDICNEKKIPQDEKLYHASKVGYPEASYQIKLQQSAYDSEKSSLTEDQGKPCNSSESTESRKRKHPSPPLATTTNARNTGTVFRIVLNQGKKENPSLSLPTGKVNSQPQKADVEPKMAVSKFRITPSISNLKHADVVDNNSASKFRIAPAKNNPTQQLSITPPKSYPTQQLSIISSIKEKLPTSKDVKNKEKLPTSKDVKNKEKLPCPEKRIDLVPTSKDENREKLPSPRKKIDRVPSSKHEKKLPRPLRKFNSLFESWAPSPMDLDPVAEEEDWLLGSKKEVKRMKCCKELLPIGGNSGMQPQAHFLSDVEIYALPFTVPF